MGESAAVLTGSYSKRSRIPSARPTRLAIGPFSARNPSLRTKSSSAGDDRASALGSTKCQYSGSWPTLCMPSQSPTAFTLDVTGTSARNRDVITSSSCRR